MKKILLISVLILSLLVSAASAAPTRRRSEPFALEEVQLMAVQPLLNAVADAAFQKDIMAYARGTAPDQALVEGVLVRALKEGMFPVELKGASLAFTQDQAQDMAARLFAWRDSPLSQGGLTIDLSARHDFIGVHAYSAVTDAAGETVVEGDVYRLSGIEGMAADVPEDSIAWIGHISLALNKADDAPAGYTLMSFTVSQRYQATGFHQITDEENGYELSYPDIFPAHEAPLQKGEALKLTSADGASGLSVTFVPGSLADLQAAWQAEAGQAGQAKVWMTDHGQLTWQGPGEMRLAMPDEQAGQCLVLSYTHPEDKPHEHGLYWEFMDNSFVVYAHAAG